MKWSARLKNTDIGIRGLTIKRDTESNTESGWSVGCLADYTMADDDNGLDRWSFRILTSDYIG